MVIRAIRGHVATHNWFAVAVDVLIVVAGVFLGTQANNWNDSRIAANEAHTNRERLIEDVTANQIDFAGRMAYYSSVRTHALSALGGLRMPPTALGEPFLVDSYQASQVNARALRRSTYEELVSEGALSTLGNPALRDIAEAYYQGLAVLDDNNNHLPPYRDRIRRELPYSVVNAIRERCGDQVHEEHGVVIFALPSDCHPGFDSATVREAVTQLKLAPELDRDLSRYIVDIDVRTSNLEGSDRRAVKFLAALRQANAGSPQ